MSTIVAYIELSGMPKPGSGSPLARATARAASVQAALRPALLNDL